MKRLQLKYVETKPTLSSPQKIIHCVTSKKCITLYISRSPITGEQKTV